MSGIPSVEESKRAAQQALLMSKEELEKRGIDWDRLAKKLREKLDAKNRETVKLKGQILVRKRGRPRKDVPVPNRLLPEIAQGVETLAVGSKFEADKEGRVYDDGETVIAWDEEAHDIQVKALDMAFRLINAYPPERRELAVPGGGPIPISRLEVEFVSPPGQEKKR